LKEIGGFDPYFGLKDVPIRLDEIELCYRIEKNGGKILYTPKAIVYHKVTKDKFNKQILLYDEFWRGVSAGIFFKKHIKKGKWKIFGKPLIILISYFFYSKFLIKSNSRFYYKLKLYRNLGYFQTMLNIKYKLFKTQ